MKCFTVKGLTRNVFLIFMVFSCGYIALAQQKETYRIGMMYDVSTPETESLLTELEKTIKSVVGEDANIEFPDQISLDHNFSISKAKSNYTTLSTSADIIIAVGTASTLALQDMKAFPKPTILFGTLSEDLVDMDLSQGKSNIENFTYLMGLQSFKEDLKAFHELTQFENVAIAVESEIADNLPFKDSFDKITSELGVDYQILPFKDYKDIANTPNNADAVYLAGGFFISDEEIQLLSAALIERGISSFTSTGPNDVELGIMGTNSSDSNVDQIFRRVALTVEAYINGQPLSEQNIYVDFEQRLTLNFNTMQQLGVPIRYSLIARTDFVGNPDNQISEKDYSLLDLINENLERNLGLQASQKNVELSQQDVKTANSNYYPSLTANASFTNIDDRIAQIGNPEFSTDGNLQLDQTIYSEAATANINIQKNLKKAQEANYNADQLDAVLTASNLYFNALISKVNVQIQDQNLKVTRENLKLAEQNFDAGQSSKSDMLRFRSQAAQNTQTLIEAINQLEQSYISINQLLNNPIDMEIEVKDAILGEGIFKEYNYTQLADILDNPALREPFIKFLIDEAKTNSPELLSLDYNIKAVERNYKLNNLGRLIPTVSLRANFNQNFDQSGEGSIDPDPDNNYNVGINLSLPILNRFRTNINRQTAKIQQDQLNLNKENTHRSIEANVSSEVLNVINQIANIRLAGVSAEAAKESLDLVQTSYSEGAVSVIQLIDAQNNYLDAQLAQASATYNFLLGTIQLERFIAYNFLLHTEQENNEFEQRFADFLNNNN